MMDRILNFFVACRALFASTIRRRRPRTFDTATAGRQRSTLELGKSRQIFGAFPYVADITESNTKWGTRKSSGGRK